jgi:hypothetical protein
MERDVDDIRRYWLDQPLVGLLDPARLYSIRSCTRMACFRADEFVSCAGDPADEFYPLREGAVSALAIDVYQLISFCEQERRLVIAI